MEGGRARGREGGVFATKGETYGAASTPGRRPHQPPASRLAQAASPVRTPEHAQAQTPTFSAPFRATHLKNGPKGIGPARACPLHPQPLLQDGSICQQVQRVGSGHHPQRCHALSCAGTRQVLRMLDAVAARSAAAAGAVPHAALSRAGLTAAAAALDRCHWRQGCIDVEQVVHCSVANGVDSHLRSRQSVACSAASPAAAAVCD